MLVTLIPLVSHQPTAAERRYGNGNWAWAFGIVLLPPGLALVLMGVSLRRRWRGRLWWQVVPLLAMGACAGAVALQG